MATLFIFIFSLISTSLCDFSLAMTTITAITKEQIACAICKPFPSPPPPVPSPPPPSPPPPKPDCPPPPLKPYCPPPPAPPPPSKPDCPPPPAPPPPSKPDCPPPPAPPPPSGPDCPPPPSVLPEKYSPPPPPPLCIPPFGGGSGCINTFPVPPPPNTFVSYFPFYSDKPNSDYSHSVRIKGHPFISSLVIIFSLLFFII